MADISKCDGVYHKNRPTPSLGGTAICPFREACYRYNATADKYGQSYIEASYILETDKCVMFYGR